MLNIKVTILLKQPGWVMCTVWATLCSTGKLREPDRGYCLKLHEQKNVNGNQHMAASSFNLQSLKNISYNQEKTKNQSTTQF